MEQIDITITKDGKDLLITNSKGREIKISNNELKASETIEFLDYKPENRYNLNPLDENIAQDKNVKYVHEIFTLIIDKINLDTEDETK